MSTHASSSLKSGSNVSGATVRRRSEPQRKTTEPERPGNRNGKTRSDSAGGSGSASGAAPAANVDALQEEAPWTWKDFRIKLARTLAILVIFSVLQTAFQKLIVEPYLVVRDPTPTDADLLEISRRAALKV
jgi:hypothetical protein